MRRAFVILASTILMTGGLSFGCGGGDAPLKIAPGTDTRTAQEKESEDLLQKSRQDYNKKARR